MSEIKINLDPQKLFIPSKKDLKTVGDSILRELITNTLAGISSVEGGDRRFAAYKDPKKYPGKAKPQRPVNLKLTGDMLNDLGYDIIVDGKGFKISFHFSKIENVLKYQNHHNAETGQAGKRQIMPINKGEKFSKKVQDLINKEINDAILRSLKK